MPPSVPQPLPHIQNVLAVAAGKGGVGKSTLSLYLAHALSKQGLRVGLLDADIHGPSLPHLLSLKKQPDAQDNKMIQPLEKYGLRVMSMGFLLPEGKAAIWRGPMVHHAIHQLLFQVSWGTLDFLILDLPPGTGDIPLSLAQKVLMDVVLVSTAQELALQDVRRAKQMFQKMGVPIRGLIENMSFVPCVGCKKPTFLWGEESRTKKEAAQQNIPFLGAVPLNTHYQKPWINEPSLQPIFQEIATSLLQDLKALPSSP